MSGLEGKAWLWRRRLIIDDGLGMEGWFGTGGVPQVPCLNHNASAVDYDMS